MTTEAQPRENRFGVADVPADGRHPQNCGALQRNLHCNGFSSAGSGVAPDKISLHFASED